MPQAARIMRCCGRSTILLWTLSVSTSELEGLEVQGRRAYGLIELKSLGVVGFRFRMSQHIGLSLVRAEYIESGMGECCKRILCHSGYSDPLCAEIGIPRRQEGLVGVRAHGAEVLGIEGLASYHHQPIQDIDKSTNVTSESEAISQLPDAVTAICRGKEMDRPSPEPLSRP